MSQANKPLKGAFINPQSQHLESTAGFSHQSTEDLGLHRTQIKSNTFERLSKVLLVIFNSGDVKTNQDIFDMFSSYVRVMRVLIFERKEPNVKCFIEMFTLQEATYVKNQFAFIKAKNPHQKHIQIYYAQIQTIDLQNHYSEGQDFQAFYARNPQVTCQYFQDCDQSMINLPSSQDCFGQAQQSPHHFQQQQAIDQQHSFAQFNAHQFKNSHEISVLDITGSFNDPNNNIISGIRPASISSSDHSKQNYRPQNMHLLPPQAGQNTVLSQFARGDNNSSNNTSSQRYQAINFIGSGSQQQQQQQPIASRKRNEIADQFHKDFLMKDGILQTHISQQFQQQNMSMQRQQQLQQQQPSLQSINSPGIGPANSNNISNQHLLFPLYGSNKKELPPSQTSSANRSPSSTTYTLPNTLQAQQQQICDLSDVDENVQASQPQTFRTKYRDEMFFNGANHEEDNILGTEGYIASPDDDNTNNSQDSKRVLFVRHLDFNDLKISMIYNLFSNYGNIVKIIFMKQKRQALIEFETISQSSAAKEHLNNLLYYGAQIKIDYSKYDQIDLQRKKLYTGEINDQEQVLAIPQQCFRYKPNKAIPQFSPKTTLHVSNIRKEYFDSNLLYEFFTNAGAKVASLKLIPNEKKQMCLVQFETLDDALRVISTLHDTPFYGRNLCISFTKSGNQGNQLGNQSFSNSSNNNNIAPGNINSAQQQYYHAHQLKNFSNEEQFKNSSQFQTLPDSSLLKPVNCTNPFQAFKPQTADLGNQHHRHLYNEIDDDGDDDSQDDKFDNDIVQAQLLNLGI